MSKAGLSQRAIRFVALLVLAAVVIACLIFNSTTSSFAQTDKDDFPKRALRIGSNLERRLGDQWSALVDEGHVNYISDDSFVPPLGQIAWELPQRAADRAKFSARIYQAEPNLRVGYIRLPRFTYDPEAVRKFAEVISLLNNETQALVVDEVNNPGGSMFQMYALVSYLTDKPLSVPKHQFRFNRDDVDAASEVIDRANAGQLTSDDTPESVAYSRFVLSEVKEGRGLGTKNTVPGFLGGITAITPAEKHYTKKIVIVVNENSFSAAEFLAAILQDNHQAVIFGQRTGGAGGLVRPVSLPPELKKAGIVGLNLTWTLAWRSIGAPIEDLGVTPDVFYNITVDDLRSDYDGYRRALLATITKP